MADETGGAAEQMLIEVALDLNKAKDELRALAGTLTPVDAGRGVTLAVAPGLI